MLYRGEKVKYLINRIDIESYIYCNFRGREAKHYFESKLLKEKWMKILDWY